MMGGAILDGELVSGAEARENYSIDGMQTMIEMVLGPGLTSARQIGLTDWEFCITLANAVGAIVGHRPGLTGEDVDKVTSALADIIKGQTFQELGRMAAGKGGA